MVDCGKCKDIRRPPFALAAYSIVGGFFIPRGYSVRETEP